jgi:hypothetical protein
MPHVGWLCGAGSVGRTFVMPSRADQIRIQGSAKFIRMMLGVLYACSTTTRPRRQIRRRLLLGRSGLYFLSCSVGVAVVTSSTI